MSSIAYVTDEKMLEFHRLCRNRTIIFWRLSSKKKFSDFRKGDLLFFYARPNGSKKKAFVGYAHYSSIKRLTLPQMWKYFGEMNGYGSYEQLKDAIEKASKNHTVPKIMSCLYLTDLVFFNVPVYPEDVGITLPVTLESYCYIDKEDPEITVRILKKANEEGVDLWSADPDNHDREIFRKDEIRHQIAMIHHGMGKESTTTREQVRAHKLAQEQIEEPGWEMVRGSQTDCLCLRNNCLYIAVPYVPQSNDKEMRKREYLGRLMIYKLNMKKTLPDQVIRFQIMTDGDVSEVKYMVDMINAE